GLERQKPVRIFVMGENVWRDEDEWPIARAQQTRYYLHAGHTLTPLAPENESADSYVYDPADPVPTAAGRRCCGPIKAGAFGQRPLEKRSDVLVYSSAPLDRDL